VLTKDIFNARMRKTMMKRSNTRPCLSESCSWWKAIFILVRITLRSCILKWKK